ncbi:MAG: hypothetical protein WCW27_01985 [Patescibacteria group bacterium]|jgi:hypothetical protein
MFKQSNIKLTAAVTAVFIAALTVIGAGCTAPVPVSNSNTNQTNQAVTNANTNANDGTYTIYAQWTIAVQWEDGTTDAETVECQPNETTTDSNDGILYEDGEEIGTCALEDGTVTFAFDDTVFTGELSSDGNLNGTITSTDGDDMQQGSAEATSADSDATDDTDITNDSDTNTNTDSDIDTSDDITIEDYDVRGRWHQYWGGAEANDSYVEFRGEKLQGEAVLSDNATGSGETVIGGFSVNPEGNFLTYEVNHGDPDAVIVSAEVVGPDRVVGEWWNSRDGWQPYAADKIKE